MKLKSLLAENRDEILSMWFERTVEAYPENTAKFLRSQTNRFANPVGHNINEAMTGVVGYLLGEMGMQELQGRLGGFVRITAVQDFTAAQAVRFVFILKQMLRDRFDQGATVEEYAVTEDRLDEIALVCFDLYVRSREKVFDLKASELRKMHFRLLEQANMIGVRNEAESGSDAKDGQ